MRIGREDLSTQRKPAMGASNPLFICFCFHAVDIYVCSWWHEKELKL
jgi:hypothetical protein